MLYSLGSYVHFFQARYKDTTCVVAPGDPCTFPEDYIMSECKRLTLVDLLTLSFTLLISVIILCVQGVIYRVLPLKASAFILSVLIQLLLISMIPIVNILYYVMYQKNTFACTPEFQTCYLDCSTEDTGLSVMWACVTAVGFFCVCAFIGLEEYHATIKSNQRYRVDEVDLSLYPSNLEEGL